MIIVMNANSSQIGSAQSLIFLTLHFQLSPHHTYTKPSETVLTDTELSLGTLRVRVYSFLSFRVS